MNLILFIIFAITCPLENSFALTIAMTWLENILTLTTTISCLENSFILKTIITLKKLFSQQQLQ